MVFKLWLYTWHDVEQFGKNQQFTFLLYYFGFKCIKGDWHHWPQSLIHSQTAAHQAWKYKSWQYYVFMQYESQIKKNFKKRIIFGIN